jgi:hypothetical protein
MRVFICGIIQGSKTGRGIHAQAYRKKLIELIERRFPSAEVYCPVELHPESPSYDDEKAFRVLQESIQAAKQSDLVIAYVPEASMGSAVEMWEARKAGVRIISITPLSHNWVVRYASDRIVSGLEEMEDLLESGALDDYFPGG